ncbi:hypothetical protein GB937_000707 [Aspergillus fischeri]|nr:hypothetical protein GB937_000707 [Aspergillus fischeri]
MAVVSFLDAGIAHLAFNVKFRQASMEARTDGYLYGPTGGDEEFAIVETKTHQRKKSTQKGRQIYMQESAEMVAWILKDECKVPLDNQRLLVAEDRDEIYLVWAPYDASYVDYLEGKPTSGNVFIAMNEIGPFKTQHGAHMRQAAEYMGSNYVTSLENSTQGIAGPCVTPAGVAISATAPQQAVLPPRAPAASEASPPTTVVYNVYAGVVNNSYYLHPTTSWAGANPPTRATTKRRRGRGKKPKKDNDERN